MWSKKRVKLLFTLFFIGVAGIIFFVNNSNKDVIIDEAGTHSYEEEVEEGESTSTPDSSDFVNNNETNCKESVILIVHICGEVNNPGVYQLEDDLRIADLVELAGGFTNEAAQDYINQAERLRDGQQIYIPSVSDIKDKSLAESLMSENEGKETSPSMTTEAEQGKVNINTASAEELMTLPGIGQAKAESIIKYREENGNYSSIDAIMNVTGIKEGLFNNISEYITI